MERIKKTLTVSIFEVFEKMFYIFLEPASENGGEYESTALIDFSGPAKGFIRVHFSRSMAEAMAQNMLNIDRRELTETLLEDCLKESANMICGNFLRNLDTVKVFNLSLPVLAAYPDATGRPIPLPSEDALELSFASGKGTLGVVFSGIH
jgi:CheY-specific phosphatase CheX